MSEKIIVLHPENQPEVDIYPIIKEGSIPNSVIDNQKIKSRTIINSNIALGTLKYEVLHQTLKDLIDSKITQANMENYLSSYYYNVEETQQYVGSEINTLHQTIQNEFYSKTAIDDMLIEKTDLSLFRQYLPSNYLNLVKQEDNQTSNLHLYATGNIFLNNFGNKNNSSNYYLPNSLTKVEDAERGYYVLSTTNDDYQSLYNLGAYDKIITNSDGTYTITRKTGYVDLGDLKWELVNGVFKAQLLGALNIEGTYNAPHVLCSKYEAKNSDGTAPRIIGLWEGTSYENYIGVEDTTYSNVTDFKVSNAGIILQYELATSTTERVEKNHYARYNERFILEHNKSEAERSSNVWNEEWELGDFNWNTGEPTNNNSRYRSKSFSRIKPSTSYFISAPNGIDILFYDSSKNYIINIYRNNASFVTPNNAYYLKICNTATNVYNNDIMLNEGSVALPYQPYEGKTIHEKDLGNYTNIYNVSQLYQHRYEIELQPSGDTAYITCWSTKSDKILLRDITRYAFSNIQVYNSTNDETIQVIKWDTTGFNYIGNNGTIVGNGYTVVHYYINGEPTTY